MQDSDFHPIFYIRADWADRGFGSYQRIYIYKEETAATFVFMCFFTLESQKLYSMENDKRAPGGRIEQYYIVLVCTLLIPCVHCTMYNVLSRVGRFWLFSICRLFEDPLGTKWGKQV